VAASNETGKIEGSMSNHFYLQKKKLLAEIKIETLEQLRAVQEENAEAFLHRVERCGRIMELVDQLDEQKQDITPSEEQELKMLLQEIMDVRQQITPLLAPLHNRLQQNAAMEGRKAIIQKGYNEEATYLPSIFFDRKN
jgi:protein subunit release factor A